MTPNNLNVCLLPLTIEWNEVEKNIENFCRQIADVHPQTDLVVVPETFLTGFPVTDSRAEIINECEKYQKRILEILVESSHKYNVAICGSTILYKDGALTNSGFFVEPNRDVSFSAKRHLFTMGGEDKIFEKGENRLQVRYRGWNIALCVCYDVRFPVWSRNVANEYDLLVYVANWPEVRISAWDRLLPARAIENQAFVCGVDCKGIDSKGYHYNGSSHILDYKGDEVGKFYGEDSIYASLSLEKLQSFRKKFPAWEDADKFKL